MLYLTTFPHGRCRIGGGRRTNLIFRSSQQQQQMAQFQKTQQMQMMQQMQRDQSDMELAGHRPQSPASADNAPSPSKRPRLEGAVNGQQLAPNGRGQGQGIPGQPNPQAMMMQNGMQRGLTPAQFQQYQQQGQAAQQKNMQVYAQNLAFHHFRSASNSQGISNGGMMNPGVMPNQTDMVGMPDGQALYQMNGDYYGATGQLPQVRPGMQTPGPQHGNHALQDYQMQLMLLEQQNKRRLMMARQEQDSMAARADGQPPMPGQGGLPPGTSPGSRAGASPNPSDQMKRGTPKMPQNGLPGSPSAADMSQRGSPGSMNLNGGQMPPEMAAQFFPGPNMRPPSSNPAFSGAQMGQPIPANAQRMPSGQWPQGQQPMPMQHSPAGQPQAGTPQERSAMPPPSAPPVTGPNAGRGQPASPQTAGNAPPTPQQSNKPAPKGKKDTKDTRKVCISLAIQLSVFANLNSSGPPRRLPLQLQLQVQLLPPKPQTLRQRRLHQLLSHLNIPTPSTRTERMGLHRDSPRHLPLRLWFSRRLTKPSNLSLISVFLMYVPLQVLTGTGLKNRH